MFKIAKMQTLVVLFLLFTVCVANDGDVYVYNEFNNCKYRDKYNNNHETGEILCNSGSQSSSLKTLKVVNS